MKKLLIASAALAMVAGTAQAQSSVSVYGIVDQAFATTKTDAATSTQSGGLVKDTLLSSRLGFRGTEDLGGGLKANFVLEGSLNLGTGTLGSTAAATNSTVANFNRAAWLGLSSATLGEIRIGRQDVTNQSNFFPAVVTTAGNLQSGAITSVTADRDQTVNYISPTYSGFQLQVGHSSANAVTASAVTTEATTGSVDAYAVQYSAGKLTVVAGVAEQKASASVDNLKDKMYGIKYDFGVAEVSGGVHDQKEADGGSEKKSKYFSVAVPLSALGTNVKAHAIYVDLDNVSTPTSSSTAVKLGLSKGFSKRTTGYAVYTSTKLETSPSTTPTSLIVGVAHTF